MGMRPAQRPKNKAMRSSVTACTIPATGVRPPFFTLVAVRAIAPVAGIPPNSGDAMFATPCATSSMFERWRPPIMPSATTAERSDSIAPSSAIVNAGAMSPGSCCTVIAGSLGRRSVASMAPNRVPMVSTGIWSSWTTAVVTISATNGLGTRRFRYGHPTMIARATTATSTAHGAAVSRWAPKARHLSRKSAGTAPMRRPRKSFTWLEKMMSAMPLVKPMVTGKGMNLIAPPSRTRPNRSRITPAIRVAAASPSTPCFWTIAYTMTTNAPVGPPIWTREPPNAEMRNPATIAVNKPRSGVTPLAIANAIASGSATMPTITPATTSANSWSRL